jgi:hypothetical protein
MRSTFFAPGLRRFATIGLVLVGVPGVAQAHVAFDSPLAGDTLVVGETVSVAWTDLVLHDPESFALDLLMSEDGEAIPIAHGLSIDTHSYEWVPEEPCAPCFLRVTQFNTFNYDYYETIPITITGSGASGGSGGIGGSSGDESGGASGSSEGGEGASSNGGVGGSASSDGGTNSSGGSDTSGGSGGSAAANGGAAGSSVESGGTTAAGAPSAGAASAGGPGEGDEGSSDEGCSTSRRPRSPSSAALVTALLVGLTTAFRISRSRLRRTTSGTY